MTIWAYLPFALTAFILALFLWSYWSERRKGKESQLSVGGPWTAAGLALAMVSWWPGGHALAKWSSLLALALVCYGYWLGRRHRGIEKTEDAAQPTAGGDGDEE